ncbi:MAG: DUF2341 domain-containing protein [Aquabacterium sp.]
MALAALALALPALPGWAWWDGDYTQRTRVSLNTGPAGVTTREAVNGAVLPVRLHSGNFDFLKAKPDGSDLRVIAGDDKSPLKFVVERFDAANELAVLWVQWPSIAPGSDRNMAYVYAGNARAQALPAEPLWDPATVAAIGFADRDGLARIAGTAADPAGGPRFSAQDVGIVGGAARLTGAALEWPASERLRTAVGAPYSASLWLKPESAAGVLWAQGPLRVALEGGKVAARIGRLALAGGELPVGTWAHVAVVLGAGKATLYVNGTQAAQVDAPGLPAIDGPLRIGDGLSGTIDELRLDAAARSADWVAMQRAALGADAKLVASVRQAPGDEADGDPGYMGILVKNLTLDAWIVIGILGVMLVVACWVMVTKTRLVVALDRGNQQFLQRFREVADVLGVEGVARHPGSSLARLYDVGLEQVRRRLTARPGEPLSNASLDAVRAAVDANLVRENHDLNARMVLLTIAISGGPFLGLLGTVVGVMITFAAIAAAGDVNVNAIAPGIAAALLATVAGLVVAIPALFAYNWLAARIKNTASDMQIFVDEFVTRVAEQHGPGSAR